MRTPRLPQDYCCDLSDHPGHRWDDGWQGWKDGVRADWLRNSGIFGSRAAGDSALRRYEVDSITPIEKHCPGRHTPSNHRAPHATPAVPADPFAGIEEAYGEETD